MLERHEEIIKRTVVTEGKYCSSQCDYMDCSRGIWVSHCTKYGRRIEQRGYNAHRLPDCIKDYPLEIGS